MAKSVEISKDLANSANDEGVRFLVQTIKADGTVVNLHRTDDAAIAIRTYVNASRQDFGKEHGTGSYVALVDSQLKLDVARVAEGMGSYRVHFRKDEGRIAIEEIEQAMQLETARTRLNVALNGKHGLAQDTADDQRLVSRPARHDPLELALRDFKTTIALSHNPSEKISEVEAIKNIAARHLSNENVLRATDLPGKTDFISKDAAALWVKADARDFSKIMSESGRVIASNHMKRNASTFYRDELSSARATERSAKRVPGSDLSR